MKGDISRRVSNLNIHVLCFENFMRKRFSTVDLLNILSKKHYDSTPKIPRARIFKLPDLDAFRWSTKQITANLTTSNKFSFNSLYIMSPIAFVTFRWTSESVMNISFISMANESTVLWFCFLLCYAGHRQCPVFILYHNFRLTTNSRKQLSSFLGYISQPVSAK
jgi:hypothetical protein